MPTDGPGRWLCAGTHWGSVLPQQAETTERLQPGKEDKEIFFPSTVTLLPAFRSSPRGSLLRGAHAELCLLARVSKKCRVRDAETSVSLSVPAG